MTAISPERTESGTEPFTFEDAEFDIICDISKMNGVDPKFPTCHGDPARWVAWRANCCPESPRYRLVCDHCKKVYQAWMAKQAHITCAHCGRETGGFISFTPLKGRS